jgi:hypothetical protein
VLQARFADARRLVATATDGVVHVWDVIAGTQIQRLVSALEQAPGGHYVYQSGIGFKCPYSNRPLKPLTPSISLTQSLFSGT